jgi:branched-chain amino acid transport system ATP-binding protein
MRLDIRRLRAGYGRIVAVVDVSLAVDEGEIVALFGPNGAGKSTTLLTISGVLARFGGEIWFEGARIDELSAPKRVRLGIAHVPEGRRIFAELTVLENLEVAALSLPRGAERHRRLREVLESFPHLVRARDRAAGTLSGGEQQMLAVGRALVTRPRLLLLDEPSLGLAPKAAADVRERVVAVAREGTSVLLVEQHVQGALAIASRAYVMETGRIVAEGSAQELRDNPKWRAAYLG